ncbi:MAG TPA: 50S ribosomal protein L9 [Gemmatimonadetes bacterium]|jgi:large subunit ribosomal protein L9|nr:50S ribosomal protein L9 [Gemmatimonadota bacterium]HIB08617.1 50S ribosomal protein L9 [Gemmatimonadota bacterium]HIC13749.1 50S ribosomal protein L9 [Gemmatimonadota bacterium]HIN79412.1 50S ribosomal protein L9 [Gemmatimonadota bacterium]
MMKLILKKSVENLGEAGEVIQVKPGFGRNYLIPQGLAYIATQANIQRLEQEQAQSEERSKRDFLEASRRASQLEAISPVIFHARAGDDGKLFGSVTSADIADRINESSVDFELNRREILLDDPIKMLGVWEISLNLHGEVRASIEVHVERE